MSHFSAPCWLICCWSIPANLLHSNKWIRYMLKLLLSPCYYMSLLVWFFLEISTCIMHSSSTCLSLEFLLDHSLFWPLDLFMFMLMVVCLSAMLFEIRLRFQFFLKMILKRKNEGGLSIGVCLPTARGSVRCQTNFRHILGASLCLPFCLLCFLMWCTVPGGKIYFPSNSNPFLAFEMKVRGGN